MATYRFYLDSRKDFQSVLLGKRFSFGVLSLRNDSLDSKEAQGQDYSFTMKRKSIDLGKILTATRGRRKAPPFKIGIVVVWMRMFPVGSQAVMLCLQLVELFSRNYKVQLFWRRCVTVVGL